MAKAKSTKQDAEAGNTASDTVTLFSPANFNVNVVPTEPVITVVKGTNENFPADLVDHWFVKAHGCTVVNTTTAPAPSIDPADDLAAKAAAEAAALAEAEANTQAALAAEAEQRAAALAQTPGAPWATK